MWRYWLFLTLVSVAHYTQMLLCLSGLHQWRLSTSTDNTQTHILRRCRRCWSYQLHWDDHWHDIDGEPNSANIETTFTRARKIEADRMRRTFEQANIKAGIDPIYWKNRNWD